MNPIIEHRIMPMRNAQQQFELAGCETILTSFNPQTKLACVDGKGGPACLPEEEWENYKSLCAQWKASPVDLQGSASVWVPSVMGLEKAREIAQQRIPPDDLRRIYQSLRITLQEARACVTSAQHTLSVEDYGEALQAASEKLSLSIGCVEGLEDELNNTTPKGGPDAA